ncbi:MAG TPA: hypothetical protein VGS03_01945 [Candidatus Polarisedimenticolia bacterium]|jgi:hypothetical protein|nr:hypothetical protein [Candidatus Polarisedimenticolia bacterium]
MFVALRSKMPRLKVLDRGRQVTCANSIYATATFLKNSGGFAGGVGIDVMRMATIQETGMQTQLSVWSNDSVITGPPGGQLSSTSETIDEMITALASDYYEAGNE